MFVHVLIVHERNSADYEGKRNISVSLSNKVVIDTVRLRNTSEGAIRLIVL